MRDKLEREAVDLAEQSWQALCDEDGKETIEMAEPRDLFQMGFNAGCRAANNWIEVDQNMVDEINKKEGWCGFTLEDLRDIRNAMLGRCFND